MLRRAIGSSSNDYKPFVKKSDSINSYTVIDQGEFEGLCGN